MVSKQNTCILSWEICVCLCTTIKPNMMDANNLHFVLQYITVEQA